MKYLFAIVLFLSVAFGQFKEDLDNSEQVHNILYTDGPSGFFTNFLSSENFKMKHSITMSYSSFGGNGVALGVYTNSMFFKFADNLNLEIDASFVNSPYNSLGQNFTNDINGFYLSKARLNFKPTENSNVVIEYRQLPRSYGYGYGYGYDYDYYRGYRGSFFKNSFFDE